MAEIPDLCGSTAGLLFISGVFPPISWQFLFKPTILEADTEETGALQCFWLQQLLMFTTCQDGLKTLKEEASGEVQADLFALIGELNAFLTELNNLGKAAKQLLSWSNIPAFYTNCRRFVGVTGHSKPPWISDCGNYKRLNNSTNDHLLPVWTVIPYFINCHAYFYMMSQISNKPLSFLDVEAVK